MWFHIACIPGSKTGVTYNTTMFVCVSRSALIINTANPTGPTTLCIIIAKLSVERTETDGRRACPPTARCGLKAHQFLFESGHWCFQCDCHIVSYLLCSFLIVVFWDNEAWWFSTLKKNWLIDLLIDCCLERLQVFYNKRNNCGIIHPLLYPPSAADVKILWVLSCLTKCIVSTLLQNNLKS